MKYLFFLFLTYYTTIQDHDYYVSIMDVEYNESSNSMEITVKVFTDDLEKTLKEYREDFTNIEEMDKETDLDETLYKYCKEHIVFTVNKKEEGYTFIGKEIEIEQSFIYLEIPKVKKLKQIEIQTNFLTNYNDEQKNIVHFKKGSKTKSVYLSNRKTKGKVSFR